MIKFLSIKWIPQSDDSLCGIACTRMILDYYGFKSKEKEIAKACKHTYKNGCNNEDMVNCLQAYGIGAALQKNLTIDDLRYWSQHKIPVIVDWFPFEYDIKSKHNYGHSCVVKGVDKQHIYLLDPLQKSVSKIKIQNFIDNWYDFDNAGKEVYHGAIIAYPSKLVMPIQIPMPHHM